MKSPLRRRDFLKASAAAVAAGTVLDSSQNTASAQIRPVPGGDKLTVYQVEPENEQFGSDGATSY